jgi:hypothetical protein
MKTIILIPRLALIVSILLLLATDANAAPVVFIVRHAEKANNWR